MTPKEKMTNKELVTENETLKARVAELEEKLALSEQIARKMQSAPVAQPSKSKVQAEQALALLQKGPVTTEQLKAINEKYPSDPIYFVRSILKVKVVTHRSKDGGTVYNLPGAETSDQKDGSEDQKASDQKPSKSDQKAGSDEKAHALAA